MKYKSLTEYANEIQINKSNPHYLSELHVELAGKYAYISDIAKESQLKKAEFWNTKFFDGEKEREKQLSDTHVEAKWIQTEDGKEEIRLKYELKALEKLMSSIKTNLYINNIESYNNY